MQVFHRLLFHVASPAINFLFRASIVVFRTIKAIQELEMRLLDGNSLVHFFLFKNCWSQIL